jgi:hypothetical protein
MQHNQEGKLMKHGRSQSFIDTVGRRIQDPTVWVVVTEKLWEDPRSTGVNTPDLTVFHRLFATLSWWRPMIHHLWFTTWFEIHCWYITLSGRILNVDGLTDCMRTNQWRQSNQPDLKFRQIGLSYRTYGICDNLVKWTIQFLHITHWCRLSGVEVACCDD